MRIRILFSVAFILFFAGQGISFANFLVYEGLRFSSQPDFQNTGYSGYNFMRFLVSNGSERTRNVKLTLRADYSQDLNSVSRSFAIQPGETREESLVFPVSDFSSSGTSVTVDGIEISERITRHFRTYKNYYANPQVLVDSRLSRTDFDAVFGSSGALGSLKLEFNQFSGSPSQLYRNWLAYSQFNLLLYYGKTLTEMPAEVRMAVFDYVRAGGSLLLLGPTSLPSDFQQKALPSDQHWQRYEGGFGNVSVLPANVLQSRPAPARSLESFNLEDPVESAGSSGPDLTFWKKFPAALLPICDPFSSNRIKSKSPIEFSIDESEKVSARWLMLIVYIFAFIIGPVNIYVLYRTGRRLLVFLTVPMASLVCCAFIYGYYLAFESSTLLVRRQTLTLLDERYSRAVVLGNYAVFSSSRRDGGLRFDMNTEVYQISNNDYRSFDAGKSIVLDEEQHLAEGWIKPKVPRYLHLRSVQNRRERLVASLQNGQMTLTNGLGADIGKVHLMTSSGRVFTASDVAAGDAVIMNELSSFRISRAASPAKIFADGWYNKISGLSNDYQMNYLQPGAYVASLKKSPFFRQSFEDEAQVTEEACIIGILKEDPEK